MTLVACWLAFPLVLLAVSAGCGLLLGALAGRSLPGALVVPAGLAAIIVVAGLLTAAESTAPLATPVVVVLALAGLALAARRGPLPRPDPWLLAAALGTFAVYAAPTVLTGQATFLGYVKLDDTATWLNITDQVMSHGRALGHLGTSSFKTNLEYYLGTTGYPVGAFLPLGVGRALVGQDLAWVFQPYLAFLAAALVPSLAAIAAPLVPGPRLRALCAFLAPQAALLYGYSLWGGVKELATATLLGLLAAAAIAFWTAADRGWRAAAPLAVAGAALLAVMGPGAAPFLGPLILALAAGGRLRAAGALLRAGAIAAVLAVPTWLVLHAFIKGGGPVYTKGSGLYNLVHPLSVFQLAGIWPSGDFRYHPHASAATATLIAATLLFAALGLALAVRQRAYALLAYALLALAGCALIAATSTPWIAAKGMASAAPVIPLLAAVGGAVLWTRGHRAAGATALAVLAGGLLWSVALAYRHVSLAPRDRFAELQTLGPKVAHQGRTFVLPLEIFADRHFLRAGDPEGLADYRPDQLALTDGATLQKDGYADLDAIPPATLLPFRSLVLPRSPIVSRPPSGYTRTWAGRFYELWQRAPGRPPAILAHVGLGDQGTRPFCGYTATIYQGACPQQPAAVPSCAAVGRLAALARQDHARLVVAPRAAPVVVPADRMRWPRAWPLYAAGHTLYPRTPGTATSQVRLGRTARYSVWLGGSFARGLRVTIDGRRIGRVRDEQAYLGQFFAAGAATLTAGIHRVDVTLPAPGWRPGDARAADLLTAVVLAPPDAATAAAPVTVAPQAAPALCHRSLDWMEVVR